MGGASPVASTPARQFATKVIAVLLPLISTHDLLVGLQESARLVMRRSKCDVCVVGQSGRRGAEIGRPGQVSRRSLAILSVEGK